MLFGFKYKKKLFLNKNCFELLFFSTIFLQASCKQSVKLTLGYRYFRSGVGKLQPADSMRQKPQANNSTHFSLSLLLTPKKKNFYRSLYFVPKNQKIRDRFKVKIFLEMTVVRPENEFNFRMRASS